MAMALRFLAHRANGVPRAKRANTAIRVLRSRVRAARCAYGLYNSRRRETHRRCGRHASDAPMSRALARNVACFGSVAVRTIAVVCLLAAATASADPAPGDE